MRLSEVLEKRRSVRKYKVDSVPPGVEYELIEAARLAPSGKNLQPARFIIVRDTEMRKKIAAHSTLPFLAEAPMLIVCCYNRDAAGETDLRMAELQAVDAFAGTPLDASQSDPDNPPRGREMSPEELEYYLQLNTALAIEHIILKAVELGLGSSWVMMFDKPGITSLLELTEQYAPLAILPIGYPAKDIPSRPRLAQSELILKEF